MPTLLAAFRRRPRRRRRPRIERGEAGFRDPPAKLPIELTGPPLRAGVIWVWRAGNLSGLVPVESLQP